MADQVFNVLSGFYNAVSGDRTYDADDMNRPYRRLVSNGVFATADGTPSNDLRVVSSSGMVITVKKGEGIFGDKWFENAADQSITVPNNSAVLPRVDSVLVQIDLTIGGRVGSLVYRTGTPASNPVPPNINTSDSVIEYRLANVAVAASAASISQSNISDLRGSSECPWVTSLVKQVDTSVLFAQWQAAYAEYYASSTSSFEDYVAAQRSAWEAFLESLTDDLTVATNVLSYASRYVTSAEVSSIPIGIASYDKTTDILQVYVNGLKASEIVFYTVDANGENILLSSPIPADQTVDFVVFKSVISADLASTETLIQALDAKVSAAIADSGWLPLTPENGAAAYNAGYALEYRRIGKAVYLRGAFTGVTAVGTTIATLPIGFYPTRPHVFTTNQVSGSSYGRTVVMQITTAGLIKILAASNTLSSTALCSIATSFLND